MKKENNRLIEEGKYKIKIKPIIIFSMVVLFIYTAISSIAVSGVRDIVDSGYLEGIECLDNGNVKLRGEEKETFAKYKYAVVYGEENGFTFAEDGFVYIDTLGIGRKTFVFDYKWYGGMKLDSRKVVNYIDDNYWMMVVRNVVYSTQYITFIVLVIGLSIWNKWLIPIYTQLFASLFGFVRVIKERIIGEGISGHIRVYESRLIRKVVEYYDRSYSLGYMTMVIAFIISLYSRRYEEELAVYVAFMLNTVIGVIYILNILAINHIKIIKENKGEQ